MNTVIYIDTITEKAEMGSQKLFNLSSHCANLSP